MEELNMNNEMNYVPNIVDIEGLQGMNSSQGMEYLMQDLENMDTMYNVNDIEQNAMWPMPGMDHMGNMGSIPGMDNMNGYHYMPQGGTCAEVMSCMATMCYMMSVYFTQMLQSGNGMGMYPVPMQNCDCMQYNTMNNEYGYPPIY